MGDSCKLYFRTGWKLYKYVKAVAPNLSGARDQFRGGRSSHGPGGVVSHTPWILRMRRWGFAHLHDQFLVGRRPVTVCGPGIGDPCVKE